MCAFCCCFVFACVCLLVVVCLLVCVVCCAFVYCDLVVVFGVYSCFLCVFSVLLCLSVFDYVF